HGGHRVAARAARAAAARARLALQLFDPEDGLASEPERDGGGASEPGARAERVRGHQNTPRSATLAGPTASSALGSPVSARNSTRLVPSAAPPTMKATVAMVAWSLASLPWLTASALQRYGRS